MEIDESLPSSTASENATTTNTQSDAEYATPILSQKDVNQSLALDADNEQSCRQRRRRTRYKSSDTTRNPSVYSMSDSPQDQAILEAHFERNPKPDKAARMGIVSRVALGEKEVQVSRSFSRVAKQIWLQEC